jgi:hypothetical protein
MPALNGTVIAVWRIAKAVAPYIRIDKYITLAYSSYIRVCRYGEAHVGRSAGGSREIRRHRQRRQQGIHDDRLLRADRLRVR